MMCNGHHATFASQVLCAECTPEARPFPPDLPPHERRRAVNKLLDEYSLWTRRLEGSISSHYQEEASRECNRLRDCVILWIGLSP